MKKLQKIFLALFFSFLLSTMDNGLSTIYAAIPHLINYQGRLTDTNGAPLNGSYDVTFRIYDAQTAGNLLWEETHTGVVIDKGLFGVLLGSVTALNIPFDIPYFLEIKVGQEVMSPRQRITSAGYAMRAEVADNAGLVGTKTVDEAGLVNGMSPYYDSTNNKIKYKDITNHWVQVEVRTIGGSGQEIFLNLQPGVLYRVYWFVATNSKVSATINGDDNSANYLTVGLIAGGASIGGAVGINLQGSAMGSAGVGGSGEFEFVTRPGNNKVVYFNGHAFTNNTNPPPYYSYWSFGGKWADSAGQNFNSMTMKIKGTGKIILEKYVP